MGADAELLVLDYDRYRGTVVPGLVELIGGSGPTPWFEGVHDRLGELFGDDWRDLVTDLQDQPVDLARHCTWLGADLRHLGPQPASRDAWLRTGRWEDVRCPSAVCPERAHCLLHEQAPAGAAEMLFRLFDAAATECCLGEPRFLGRNTTLRDLRPALHELKVPAGDRVFALLDALGGRGAALGHLPSGADGVHGWLTPAETAELAQRLDLLVIGADGPWPRLALSSVRVLAGRATSGGHGVLFGHDISPS